MQRLPLGELEMDSTSNISQHTMNQLLQSCTALHAVSSNNFTLPTTNNATVATNTNSSNVNGSALMPLQPRKIQPNDNGANSRVNDENAGPLSAAPSGQSKVELRADLNQLAALRRNRAPTMSRRNERERNRVRYLNFTFDVLRQHLPRERAKGKAKKMSKVDTLRGAIDYIRDLQDVLGDGITKIDSSASPSSMASPPGGASASSFAGTESEADSLSPAGSPRYSGDSPEGASEPLSDQEEDLSHLAGWFC